MKSSHWGLMLLAVGLIVGMLVGDGVLERNAEAQGVAISPPPARFQISAWSYAAPQGGGPPGPGGVPPVRVSRGCYIVDTVTGEFWHAAADEQPKKISLR